MTDRTPEPVEFPEVDPLRVSAHRLRDAVTSLARSVGEPEVRVQLHALAGIVAALDAPPVGNDATAELDAAIARGDEGAVVDAMRRQAARDRARVPEIDWTRASNG